MRVSIRLSGGLGNQMFQYAAARAAALDRGAQLVLDLRSLSGDHGHNNYGLDFFRLAEKNLRTTHIRTHGIRSALQRLTKPKILRRYVSVHHQQRHFEPFPETGGNDLNLRGYFQSEAYFADIAGILRRDFLPVAPLSDAANLWLDRIKATPTAGSLHIRRGDYTDNRTQPGPYVDCAPDYYRNAAKLIADQVGPPSLFVFTDDPDWVRRNASFDHPTFFVDSTDRLSPHSDMMLMAACDHNIIANSTFSWWGAWLNNAADKIVITPDRWFRRTAIERFDQVPESWIKLPSGDPLVQRPS